MSSFMVSNETINRAVWLWEYPDNVQRPPEAWEACQQMGERLQLANVRAVLARYPHHADDWAVTRFDYCGRGPEGREPQRGGKPIGEPYTLLAAIKAAQCLRYQCGETEPGESATVWENCTFCRQVDEAITTALWHVASQQPEYVAAPWGFDSTRSTEGDGLLSARELVDAWAVGKLATVWEGGEQ
ncbi:MAG: hypothetical protein AAGJ46_20725 [Planctomycetota bacterium]